MLKVNISRVVILSPQCTCNEFSFRTEPYVFWRCAQISALLTSQCVWVAHTYKVTHKKSKKQEKNS